MTSPSSRLTAQSKPPYNQVIVNDKERTVKAKTRPLASKIYDLIQKDRITMIEFIDWLEKEKQVAYEEGVNTGWDQGMDNANAIVDQLIEDLG
jgi:flagellar biosynthesis/type III secretory pathway protein FliH